MSIFFIGVAELLMLGSLIELIEFAVFFVVVAYAPIIILVSWLGIPERIERRLGAQIAWRIGVGIGLALLYGYVLPMYLIAPFMHAPWLDPSGTWLDPNRENWLSPDSAKYPAVLIAFSTIVIALASQQAGYVDRLADKMHEWGESRRGRKPVPTKIRAAYYLLSCGFWGFSLAVIATFGLLAVYFTKPEPLEAICAAYEGLIAALMAFGWTLLLGTVLRTQGALTRGT